MHERGGRGGEGGDMWLIVQQVRAQLYCSAVTSRVRIRRDFLKTFGKTSKSIYQGANVREEKIDNEVWEERKGTG